MFKSVGLLLAVSAMATLVESSELDQDACIKHIAVKLEAFRVEKSLMSLVNVSRVSITHTPMEQPFESHAAIWSGYILHGRLILSAWLSKGCSIVPGDIHQ